MNDFNEMVKQYAVKYHCKINAITKPLKQCLGDFAFSHSRTEQDGRYFTISDRPEILEFYYEQKLHLSDPYCSHPDLIRSGVLLIPDFHKLAYKKPLHEGLKLQHGFMIVQNLGDAIENFYFDIFAKNQMDPSLLLGNIELLGQFIRYFKREAKPLLQKMRADGFNMKEAKGSAFLKN